LGAPGARSRDEFGSVFAGDLRKDMLDSATRLLECVLDPEPAAGVRPL
jgi:hypothetical protein